MREPPITLRPVVATDVPHFFHHSKEEEAIRLAMPAGDILDWPEFSKKWDRIRSNSEFFCRSAVWGHDVVGYLAQFIQMEVPSVSYWFGRQFWGRGLARQALKQFISEVDIRPLYARVASSNDASLRVLAVNGFIPVSTGRYFSAPHGEDVSEVVLRLDR